MDKLSIFIFYILEFGKVYILNMYCKYYMEYTKKTITIRKDQDKWVKDNSINLSRFVQKNIDRKKEERKNV